jgi:hypothetical protein
MILRKAFPEGGGFLNQIRVLAALRSVKSGFYQSYVPDSRSSAVKLKLILVNLQQKISC